MFFASEVNGGSTGFRAGVKLISKHARIPPAIAIGSIHRLIKSFESLHPLRRGSKASKLEKGLLVVLNEPADILATLAS